MKNDFLPQLLEAINRRMDALEKMINDNNTQMQSVLKRYDKAIARLEKNTAKTVTKKFELTPSVIYLIALGSVILLAIVASVLHVKIGGLLG